MRNLLRLPIRTSKRDEETSPPDSPSRRDMRRVALPLMAANLSEPLLGLVDAAAVGRLPEARHLAAVAMGAAIFNALFWSFGFLRMGAASEAARVDGALLAGRLNDDSSIDVLARGLAIGIVCGLVMIPLLPVIELVAFGLLEGSPDAENEARLYTRIRILSAPFAFANYAMLGWLIGIGRIRRAMIVQVVLNLLNALFDALFAYGLDMGAPGVALGTVLASVLAAVLGIVLCLGVSKPEKLKGVLRRLRRVAPMLAALALHGDLMIRTLLMLFAFSFFVAQGAKQGDDVLAANALLVQFVTLAAFLIDGFAFAAERFVGRAVGAINLAAYRRAVRFSTEGATLLAVAASISLILFGELAIELAVVNPDTRIAAKSHLPWAAAMPLLSVPCYMLDGILIGAGRGRDLRNAMAQSVIAFLLAWALLAPAWGNHGLWAAFAIFNAARGATLAVRLPAMRRELFP